MLVNKGFLENHKAARGRQTTAVYRTTTLGLQLIENLDSINKLWEKNFLQTNPEE